MNIKGDRLKKSLYAACGIAIMIISSCLVISNAYAQPTESDISEVTISMRAGNEHITAVLDSNNPTAKDFLATLPRTLTMTRWDDREYYGKVQVPLSNAGPKQSGYTDGDVTYYVPGGSYAVFFAKGGRSPISNIIVMGRVTSNLKAFDRLGSVVEMHIKIAE